MKGLHATLHTPPLRRTLLLVIGNARRPVTTSEICERAGIGVNTARPHIQALHDSALTKGDRRGNGFLWELTAEGREQYLLLAAGEVGAL